MTSTVRIWCDGSYRQEHRTMGAAWVRAAADFGCHEGRTEESIPLPLLRDAHAHGSDIAELMAFAHAIEALPHNQRVQVHMDCRNVIKWLQDGKIDNRDKMREHPIRQAFERAMRAKGRMAEIVFVQTSDRNSPNMGLAHMLSRAASNPGLQKKKAKGHAHQDPRHASRPRNARG